ncbi:U6 snRNA-associated Sm-like protein LSm7 [Penicillium taxi]|uniref:U6 snRNA-associated Sm-like protein LSm7 n=1 Tax=Penicillium taxi TaxID=168475 RepID=UPI002545328C|nr:U6 snRNA-associated Sm-like protein LSm7 [Penicillium taxi]KAJ5901784.1 U6 snRNA-associated Sm-like protein LSm7 [Penicillium taxi]
MSGRGGSIRGGDRGRGRGHNKAAGAGGHEKPKKENILDLSKYLDKELDVKFSGGREVTGTLKGYDQLMNLVLDSSKEVMRDSEGNKSTRPLGLLIVRANLLVSISPVGEALTHNPWLQKTVA